MSKYFDEYGFLHLYEGEHDSENAILFYSIWEYLKNLDARNEAYELIKLLELSKGVYSQTSWRGAEDLSSHDNTVAILYLSKKYRLKFHHEVKILGYYWHPRDIALFTFVKHPWTAPVTWPIAALLCIWSCFSRYKVRYEPHRMVYKKADGKQLNILRFYLLGIPLLVQDFILKWNPLSVFRSTKDVLRYYYKDTNHPIVRSL